MILKLYLLSITPYKFSFKSLVIPLTIFSFAHCFTQKSETEFNIRGIIIDSLNNQVIPYASIYKVRDKKGTISDYKGEFTLEKVFQTDEIICSYIGYEKKAVFANQLKQYDTIYIQRKAQITDEVVILADDAQLYRMVSNAKKTRANKEKVAKTYFEMETFHDDSQLELFQGYYNGTINGYDIVDLQMKNARFALAPLGKRIFASTETSKAMYMEKLLSSDEYFPHSPFEMSSRKLRKNYSLTLASRYKDQDNKTIYVIYFKPKVEPRKHFQGSVWIDSLSNNIIKVNLNISDAEIHPFQSIWSFHSLEKVNLEMTKSNSDVNGEMLLKSIDFNYELSYKSESDSNLNISSRAVLYAYNYNEEFILPFFNFPKLSNADYRQIQMLPYNDAFWECTNEFKVLNNSSERDYFINEKAKIKAFDLFESDTMFKKRFFEHPFLSWKEDTRILMKEESLNAKELIELKKVIPAHRYHLEVQLFMDINFICDSMQIITKTIFDPYLSFYKFPMTKESSAFINIYFDLMEIERRKMNQEILKCGNNLKLIYDKYLEGKIRALKMSEIYFKETQRGTDIEGLLKWNAIVKNKLNIDNVSIFEQVN